MNVKEPHLLMPIGKNRMVWDVEADGLLDTVKSIHCISYDQIDSGRKSTLTNTFLQPGFVKEIFEGIDQIIGHNIISYDIPLLKVFYGIDLIEMMGPEGIVDTLLWSQVSFPDRQLPKGCPNSYQCPVTGKKRTIGPHGLEGWGWRVGERKIDILDWRYCTPEIIKRCEIDISINKKVYFKLLEEMGLI